MSAAHWAVKSFNGRGSRTPHLVVGPGRRTACGTPLGYGNLAPVSRDSLAWACLRCLAAEHKLRAECPHNVKSAPGWLKVPAIEWVCDACGQEFPRETGVTR